MFRPLVKWSDCDASVQLRSVPEPARWGLLYWRNEEFSVSHRFNRHVFRFSLDLSCVRELVLDLVFLFFSGNDLQVDAVLLEACRLAVLNEEHKILDSEVVLELGYNFFCSRKHLECLQLSQLMERCHLADWADKDVSIGDWFWIYHSEAIPARNEHIPRENLLTSEVEWLVNFAMIASRAGLHSLEVERVIDFLCQCCFRLECFVLVHRLHLWAGAGFLFGRKVGKHR